MSLCCPRCGSDIFDGASCNDCDYSISDTPLTIPTFYFKDPILKSPKELEKEKTPSSSGVYGWYFDEPPPYVPKDGCTVVKTGLWPFRKKWWLLYIGQAKNLKDRIVTYHIKGRHYPEGTMSSLRLSLGCLLTKELNIFLWKIPTDKEGKYRYTFGKKEKKLNNWLRKHARVAWFITKNIDAVEKKTIAEYTLPLNYIGSTHHPLAKPLSDLGTEFKNIAKSSARRTKKKDFRKAYRHFVKDCRALGIKK